MQFNNLSVTELSNILKNILDSEEMLFNCGVVGEISSFKITNNVAYFTIKDEYAVLSCVQFSPTKEYKIGEKVKVVGRPNYYVKGGKLNFQVNFITSFGEGEIYRQFIQLKEKLEKQGYFKGKKDLPEIVRNIGVVTSSKGAVIKDIISVTKRRNQGVNIFIFPAKVQGEDAELEIKKGIEYFSLREDIDVIIVARGGGSSEDLSVFNTEMVATACFVCEKPIISAVGHETDYTLIDLVADIRASTPSVAAEIAVKESKNYLSILKFNIVRLNSAMNKTLKNEKYNLTNILKNTENIVQNLLYKHNLILNKLNFNLNYYIKDIIKRERFAIDNLVYKLKAQNPKIQLDKGFVSVEKDGKRVTSKNEVTIGDNLLIDFKDGKIKVEVKE
ncbi:MAG: exodeoxyribonuclease VII large subunit [Christensenellales bacterium]